MRPAVWGAVSATVLGLAVQARADIYRYRDRSGTLVFTNAPAAPDARLMRELPPASRMLVPMTREALRAELAKPLPRVVPTSYDRLIREIAERYEVEYALVKAVIKAESDFDRLAVSRKGALGLMQLMPQTAAQHQVVDVFLPRDNIEGGCRHLRMLLDRYGGNLPLAIAAYNAGTRTVEDAGGVPPIVETQEYLARVLRYRLARAPPRHDDRARPAPRSARRQAHRRGRPHHARRRPARAARARLDGGGDRAARAGGHGAARHRLERGRHVRRAGARQVQDDPPDVRARGASPPLPPFDSGHRPRDRLPCRRHGVSLDGARARGVVRRRLLRPHPEADPPRLSTRPAGLTVVARAAYREDSAEIPEVFGRNGAAMDSRARRSPRRVARPFTKRILGRRRHARSLLDRPAALLARDRRRRSGCARWRDVALQRPGSAPWTRRALRGA